MKKKLCFFHNFYKGLSFILLITLLFFPGLFSDFGSVNAQSEAKQITGKITDLNNAPLPGVTILIKGTSKGAITDIDGAFTLNASPTDILVISYVGYLSEEITVGDQTSLTIVMSEDIIGLNEVVVTGYGVQKKSDLTGSIASVSSEKLAEVPVAGVDQALQGRAAGVNIVSKSGRPGENSAIQIRGVTSINGVQPLVIIDGAPGKMEDMNTINSNDIASIEVLKDASSAAIYGASGGAGVIIITTKKGTSGKMKTTFNAYYGVEKQSHKMELMNSQQWMQLMEEQEWEGKSQAAKDTMKPITYRPDTLKTYDWQDIVFEPAKSQNYDISFSGGNEKSSFLISSSYFNQDGMIRNSDFRRITFRINTEQKMTKRLTIDEKVSYVNTLTNGFENWIWHDYYNNPVKAAIIMTPTSPEYDNNGKWANSIASINNPLARFDMENRKVRQNNFEANLGVKIDIVDGLSFTSRFDGRMGFYDMKEYQGIYFNTVEDRREKDVLLGSMNRSLSYDAQQILNYNKTFFNSHNVSLMAGMEAFKYWTYDITGQRDSMASTVPEMLYFSKSLDGVSSGQIVTGAGSERRQLSYFGRINYDYKGKYLLTSNIRRDGDSRFGPRNRFGVFPSISLGWKFTEEEFMKNLPYISFGKIRFGYGETGAFAKSDFPYLSLVRTPGTFGYSYNNESPSQGAAPVQIANPEIHWEAVKTTNIGIDLSFFQNTLSISAEYYKKENLGMLMIKNVPYIAGSYSMGIGFDGDYTQPEVNIGSLRNTGVEVTIGYKKVFGDLKTSFDLNFSTIKNKVLDLATDSLKAGNIHTISDICMTRIGGSVSEFYGYQVEGMFSVDDPTRKVGRKTIITNQPFSLKTNGDTVFARPDARPGDARFKDVNGDGSIDSKDKVILGSPLPKLVYGFSFNLEYKGIDLSAFFNGTWGNKIFNGTKQYTYYYQYKGNRAAEFANRYVENDIYKDGMLVVPQNRNTDVFRDATANYKDASSFYVEDGSYLRLRNLTIGYTIPDKLTKKLNIEKLRFYVSGKNLKTWTKYKGFDPEAGNSSNGNLDMGIDIGVYPSPKMFLFGVNLEF